MGGDYYDRNYIPSSLPVFSKDSNKDLDPKTHIAQGGITSPSLNPIVIAFDVTGSMGDWTKVSLSLSRYFIKNCQFFMDNL